MSSVNDAPPQQSNAEQSLLIALLSRNGKRTINQ